MTRNERMGTALAAVVLIAVALWVGYWWGGREAPGASAASVTTSQPPAATQPLYWYDPMVPDQHFDKPGKSPFMDMQLVPKYASEGAGASVSVTAGIRQNLGIRTEMAKRGRLAASLRVPGTIGWNLSEERVVSLPVEAVVEQLFVRTPYEPVRAGQPLARVRAPAWSAAFAEAQSLRNAQSAEGRALGTAASGRLRALGLPAGARNDGSGGIVLMSPINGVVSSIDIREGQALTAGMPMLRINGDSSLWAEAALPQGVAGAALVGAPVEVSVDALPGESFNGRIDALLPVVDANTRTQRARIELDNHDRRLSAGMFATVTIRSDMGAEVILVPSSAVIADGVQTRVIVKNGDRFRPVAVRTGRSAGGRTEILSGLRGDERLVVSGQFMIDSEANLSGALERIGAPAEDASHADGASPADDGARADDGSP